jgi:hypothetical protein
MKILANIKIAVRTAACGASLFLLSTVVTLAGQGVQRIKSVAIGLFLCSLFCLSASAQIGGTGWKPQTLNFKIQSPTNAPQSARYFFTNNIYHCLVFSNDGTFSNCHQQF